MELEVKAEKIREPWLDYARVAAVFCVLICHATESCYGTVLKERQMVGIRLWLAEHTLFTIGRLGVPIFLAITGTLLLCKNIKPREFYMKSLCPLILTTEIWIMLNFVFVCVFQNKEFNFLELGCQMLFLRNLELPHMWYMPMIIGIYVAIPFLAKLMNTNKEFKTYLVPLIMGIVGTALIPTINIFLKDTELSMKTVDFIISDSFLGGIYGLYLVFGYFIGRQKILTNVKSGILVAIAVVAFITNMGGQYYFYIRRIENATGLTWYNSINIFIMGLLLFELIRRFFQHNHWKCPAVIQYVARISFGIYLLHKPIIIVLLKYLPKELHDLIKIGILAVVGFGLSTLIVGISLKISKRACRVLFFVK